MVTVSLWAFSIQCRHWLSCGHFRLTCTKAYRHCFPMTLTLTVCCLTLAKCKCCRHCLQPSIQFSRAKKSSSCPATPRYIRLQIFFKRFYLNTYRENHTNCTATCKRAYRIKSLKITDTNAVIKKPVQHKNINVIVNREFI